MPSLAARILDLHAQNKSRDEIQRQTECTSNYLRSVLSRASAPDEETRKRRAKGKPAAKWSPPWMASCAAGTARKKALRQGASLDEARAAARRAYHAALADIAPALARAAQPANSIVSRRQPKQQKELTHA